MRKITTLLAAGLLATSLTTPSLAASEGRTVTKHYTITRGQIQIVGFDSENPHQASWWIGTQPESFRARAGERWVTLSLVDDTGEPVLGRVEVNGRVLEFCSETQKPLRIRRGREIAVSAIFGACNGAFSVVTEGTITAKFSK